MKTYKIILAFALVLVSNFSSAGWTTAKISRILMYEGGNLIYIYPVGGVVNPPACHGSNGDYIVYKMSRPMAKEYLSALMMAFVAKKRVSFRTEGACTDQSVADTLAYFIVLD